LGYHLEVVAKANKKIHKFWAASTRVFTGPTPYLYAIVYIHIYSQYVRKYGSIIYTSRNLLHFSPYRIETSTRNPQPTPVTPPLLISAAFTVEAMASWSTPKPSSHCLELLGGYDCGENLGI
jgi:hypothetical protein